MIGVLELVDETVERGDALLETLAFANLEHELANLASLVEGIAGDDSPVVKDTLRECLTRGV